MGPWGDQGQPTDNHPKSMIRFIRWMMSISKRRNYINSTASRVDRAILNDKKTKFEKMMKAVGVELKSDEKDA
uniref:Uncharacterized protein n=1 Tax=Phytophthora fragariae TaxID=53985 RepID=A0A6A3FKY8_9STRA|nr:hypothetical protein PF009_g3916 [Phytophthora fragariae]